MKILALDLSTTRSGYALAEEGKITQFGFIKPKASAPVFERILYTIVEVTKLIDQYEPDELVVEDVYMQFAQSYGLLGRLQGCCIWAWYKKSGKLLHMVECSHARKVMGLKVPRGKEGKQVVINYVKQLVHPDIDNDDTADACLIALCWLVEHAKN